MALHAFYPKVPGFSLGSRASFGGSRDASPRAAPRSTAQGRPNGDGRLSKSLAAGILNFHLNACASESQSLSQSRPPPSAVQVRVTLYCTVLSCTCSGCASAPPADARLWDPPEATSGSVLSLLSRAWKLHRLPIFICTASPEPAANRRHHRCCEPENP